MRARKCKMCGTIFEGTGAQRLCPDCRKLAKQATVMRPRTCVTCGTVFEGGPRARYCPACRAERQKEQNHRYKHNGSARPLGSTDICLTCGKPYIVTSGLQRYCPDCAPESVRQNVLPRKQARARAHLAENISRKKELAVDSAVCAYCGKTFTPSSPSVTCSPECAREYARISQAFAQFRCGLSHSMPSYVRYTSGLPQSDMVGVTYHRTLKKWQVTHHRKYIGVFPTQQEAEEKKRELEAQDSAPPPSSPDDPH